MFDIEVKGLKEFQRKLERLPDELQKEMEKKLQEEANKIVLSAQMKCPDPLLREKITSRISKRGEKMVITINAPNHAKQYLQEAYDENKDKISKEIRKAVKRAIEK